MANESSVKLEDKDGNAFFPASWTIDESGTTTHIQKMGLADPDTGDPIPEIATENTLSAINAKLPALSGDAIPTTDDALLELTQTLKDLAAILSMFGAMRGTDGALRVNALAAVISSLPTLSTLTNQVQLGGYSAASLVQAKMNLTAQQSNIVNMVG